MFHGLLFADLGGLRAAASQTGGNLEIKLSETETLTLVGGSLNNLNLGNVLVVPAQARASDAPVSETPPSEFLASETFVNESPTSETPADELMLNDETLIRLAESERMTLPPESQSAAICGGDQMSPADADEALALVDQAVRPACEGTKLRAEDNRKAACAVRENRSHGLTLGPFGEMAPKAASTRIFTQFASTFSLSYHFRRMMCLLTIFSKI